MNTRLLKKYHHHKTFFHLQQQPASNYMSTPASSNPNTHQRHPHINVYYTTTRYARCLEATHPAVKLMEEKAHFIKIEIRDSLENRFRRIAELRDANRESVSLFMRKNIDKMIAAYDIPLAVSSMGTYWYQAWFG